jgi:parallel beta-helix repeat protein
MSEMGSLVRPAIVAVVCLVALAFLPAEAMGTHVQCGQTVTQSVRLDSDLIDCPRNGIVIGADDITVDLGGHVVDGIRVGFGNDSGINNEAGHDGVTIENGTVQQFQFGVYVQEAERVSVSKLDVTDSLSNGILFVRASGCLVDKSVGARNAGGSINLLESNGCLVEKNSLSETFDDRSSGILLFQTNNSVVQKNDASGAFRAGIELGTATGNVVEKNSATQNTDGIFVFDSPGNSILKNDAFANRDDGIDVDSPSNLLADNRADSNLDLGIEAVPGVTDGGGNKARGNGNPAQCVGVSCR